MLFHCWENTFLGTPMVYRELKYIYSRLYSECVLLFQWIRLPRVRVQSTILIFSSQTSPMPRYCLSQKWLRIYMIADQLYIQRNLCVSKNCSRQSNDLHHSYKYVNNIIDHNMIYCCIHTQVILKRFIHTKRFLMHFKALYWKCHNNCDWSATNAQQFTQCKDNKAGLLPHCHQCWQRLRPFAVEGPRLADHASRSSIDIE